MVQSHFLVNATGHRGHHPVVMIDIMYQKCFIQNWIELTFSAMFGRSFWVLPAQHILEHLDIRKSTPPHCSLLSCCT